MDEHAHGWIANSGRGGEPEYRMNRMMGSKPLMHVRCYECGARTWFSREQWEALSEFEDRPPKESSDA